MDKKRKTAPPRYPQNFHTIKLNLSAREGSSRFFRLQSAVIYFFRTDPQGGGNDAKEEGMDELPNHKESPLMSWRRRKRVGI